MNSSGLVSVIVPVYNKEKWLSECVEALIAQTYKNIEIILIDDGSMDGSGALCDEWATRDSRIMVIHQDNHGVSYARNAGISIAQGEYIAFCDADDMIEPNTYSCMIDALIENEADMVICSYKRLEGDLLTDYKSNIMDSCVLDKITYFDKMYSSTGNFFLPFVSAETKIVRRNLLDKAGCLFQNGHIYEDNWVSHHWTINANKIYWLNESFYIWRVAEGSITQSKMTIKRLDDFYAQKDRLEYLYKDYRNYHFYSKMVEQCLDNGIQFWDRLVRNKIAHKRDLKCYVDDVKSCIRKYDSFSHGKRKILWRLFLLSPTLYECLELGKHLFDSNTMKKG